MSGKECDCRRRFDTYHRNVGSCGGKPSNESGLEKFSRCTRIATDNSQRTSRAIARGSEYANSSSTKAQREVCGELAIGEPTNTIGPEEPGHD
jgi:hypothetical protein